MDVPFVRPQVEQAPHQREDLRPKAVSRDDSLRSRNRRLGYWVLGLSATLLLGLFAFSLLWSPPAPIQARIKAVDGQEKLEVICSNCPDGSVVRLGANSATFTAGISSLNVEPALHLGVNELKLAVERIGLARDELITLQVPVDYRLAWDLSGLAATPPTVAVQVQAAPGVQVGIDGDAVDLTDGRGQHVIPVTQTQGPSAEVEWITLDVRPTVSGGYSHLAPEPLLLRIPVVPLTIVTPWAGFGTDTADVVISGRSAPGATITVEQHATQADAEGYFETTALVDQVGAHRYRVEARAHGQAPRVASVTVERVSDLKQSAIAFQKGAIGRFDRLQDAQGAIEDGQVVRVALSGRVQEWQSQGNVTVVLLGVTYGCPQRLCLVRVLHPARLDLQRQKRLSVFGTAVVPEPGSHGGLPQVQSHFVLLR